MKRALIIAVGIASTAAALSVEAQTYQWKDSRGRTVISDSPPPTAARDARSVGTGQPDATATKAQEAPKSLAEKDMEFRKRQQEANEKADKDAKEQAAAAERRENCDRARRNLALLESDQGIVTADDKGERRALDDADRRQEIERTRAILNEACK